MNLIEAIKRKLQNVAGGFVSSVKKVAPYVFKPSGIDVFQTANRLIPGGISGGIQRVSRIKPQELNFAKALERGAVSSFVPKSIQKPMGTFLRTHYVEPITNLPSNLKGTFTLKKPLLSKERGMSALGALGGVATLYPDPIGDVGLPLYEYFKGSKAEAKRTGKPMSLENVKAGIRSMTGEESVGLGSAIGKSPLQETALNLAELPLMVAATSRLTRGSKLRVSKSQYENALDLFKSRVSALEGDITKEYTPKQVDIAIENLQGKDITKAVSSFERDAIKLANFLSASKHGVLVNAPPNVGLSTQDIRRGMGAKSTQLPEANIPSKTAGTVPQAPTLGVHQKDFDRHVQVAKLLGGADDIPAIGKLPSSTDVAKNIGMDEAQYMNQVRRAAGLPQVEVPQLPKTEALPASPAEVFKPEPLPWETPEYLKQNPKTVEIPVDIATKQKADLSGGGYLGDVTDDIKIKLSNWVNQRRATKVEGILKRKEFADLDKKGFEGIIEFQAGDKTGRLADVQKYFDTKYEQVKDTGIDVNYKKNYLPQLWKNTREEVEQKLGRRLSRRPSFSLQSIFENYKEGKAAGLTPKFNTIGELIGWYERTANKTIADVNFFNTLAKDGLIQPSGQSMEGWKILDPSSFPKISVNIPGEVKYSGTYSAPPRLADMINNYLATPELGNTLQRNLARVANFVSAAKNRLLSFGIPRTAINFHGFNILARSFLDRGPVGALKTAYYMIHPGAAGKYIEKNLFKAPDAIKSGLTIGTSERPSVLESERFLSKFGSTWNEWFEKPLFDKVIVANKLQGWERLWKDYAKKMPETKAKKEASKFINTVYGGINWEEMGRSRDMQNVFRSIALTPDWLESNLKLGGNMIKSVLSPLNPTGKAYRRALTYFIGSYVGLNLVNKMTSGHNIWENDSGHTFELEVGYTPDGQKRYYRPYGTAVDFTRIPVDIVLGLLQGDPTIGPRAIRNRMSTLIQPAISLLFNVNWKGQPIYGKDKYGNEMPAAQQVGGVASEIGNIVGFPSFLREGIDYATGKQGPEQAILQGLEFPFRYSGGAYSKTQKNIAGITNLQGKELYDLNKKTLGESPLSENQLEKVKLYGESYLDTIYQSRELNKKQTALEEAYKEGTPFPEYTDAKMKAELVLSEMRKAEREGTEKVTSEKLKKAGFHTPEVRQKLKVIFDMEKKGFTKSDRELYSFQGEAKIQKVVDRLDDFTKEANQIKHLKLLVKVGVVDNVMAQQIAQIMRQKKAKQE